MDEAALLDPGEMFGDYVVERLLGKGGMGAVYLLRAPGGEEYAAKIMFPEAARRHDFRRRFAREAEFAMGLRHENLVSVYDVGEDPETRLCYIIMEYVPGGSLADLMERNGPLPIDKAVSIAMRVAVALEAAHSRGLVHRDVKPDNILFSSGGVPKLADLGIAKFEDYKSTITTTGMVLGTPAYMAPEQMMDSRAVDARADIFSLGVVLYEMIAGKRPNEESTAMELLAKAIKGEPLPDVRTMRPEAPAAVAYVISVMCAPNPDDRPETALKSVQILQKALDGALVLPKKAPRAIDAVSRRGDRRFLATALAAVAFAAMAMGFGLWGWGRRQAEPPHAKTIVVTNVLETVEVVTNEVVRQDAGGEGGKAASGKPAPRPLPVSGLTQCEEPASTNHVPAVARRRRTSPANVQSPRRKKEADFAALPVHGEGEDAEKARKWVAALVPILDRRMDGILTGELRRLGARVCVGKARTGGSPPANEVWLDFPCGDAGFKAMILRLIALGAGRRAPADVGASASALDDGIVSCLAEEVQSELVGRGLLTKSDEANASALKWALGVDLRMSAYDLRGKPARGGTARRLDDGDERRMARAKAAYVVRELGRNHRDIIAAYFRARWEAKAEGRFKDAPTDDDAAVLLSIAADVELFDWFKEHGIDVRPSRSGIPIPDRIKPKKPLEKPVEVQWK